MQYEYDLPRLKHAILRAGGVYAAKNEDCLTLNVFVPGRAQPANTDNREKLPVIVYFHGGSNFGYGGSMELSGGPLAVKGKVSARDSL